jgi:hypothetical protein
MASPTQRAAAARNVSEKPSRASFAATSTGNVLEAANSSSRPSVPSVEPSSCTTSSKGGIVWAARLASWSPR